MCLSFLRPKTGQLSPGTTNQQTTRTDLMKNIQMFRHTARWGFAALAVLALMFTSVRATEGTLQIEIRCSPSVVVMDAVAVGDCMTVHTDIAFGEVDRTVPVELNGIPAYLLKADNRGFLVAKFRLTAVRAILEAPTTVLTMQGATLSGLAFSGSDTVRVIE
jgi:hypothetical protein